MRSIKWLSILDAIHVLPFHIHDFQDKKNLLWYMPALTLIIYLQLIAPSSITKEDLRRLADRPTTIHQSTPFIHISVPSFIFILPRPTAPHYFIHITCSLSPLYRPCLIRFLFQDLLVPHSCYVPLSARASVSRRASPPSELCAHNLALTATCYD